MATLQSHSQDPDFWVFLCFGQSNMAGQAPIEKQDMAVSDRFLSMATTDGGDGRVLGKWRKAVPPLCRYDAHLGPADYFGRTLLEVVPTAGHKTTARDHVHPTFKPDGTEIEIQSAMLSEDGRSMNICIVKLPQHLLNRYPKTNK